MQMHQQLFNDFVIIAKDASTDINDGMTTLYKLVDKFEFAVNNKFYEDISKKESDNKIVLPAAYTIATSWSLNEIAQQEIPFQVKISLISPSGKVINDIVQDALIAKGKDKLRLNINTNGIPVNESGRYIFRVSALDKNNKTLATRDCGLQVKIKIEDVKNQQPRSKKDE